MTDKQRLALVRAAIGELEKTQQGHVQWEADGKPKTHWRSAMVGLRKLEADLVPDPLPVLGPIRRGGKSLLAYQLTHNTDGIPLYPAFDDNWGAGAISIAPEPLTVISPYTSSNPGAAFYARGASGPPILDRPPHPLPADRDALREGARRSAPQWRRREPSTRTGGSTRRSSWEPGSNCCTARPATAPTTRPARPRLGRN